VPEKPRNLLWDALEGAMGYRPILRNECALWGKILKGWSADGVTPDQVARAARGYKRLYPGAAFTVTALDKHFSQALAEATPKRITHDRFGPLSVVRSEPETVPPPPDFLEQLRRPAKEMP